VFGDSFSVYISELFDDSLIEYWMKMILLSGFYYSFELKRVMFGYFYSEFRTDVNYIQYRSYLKSILDWFG
jgi:hypothetical protein